MTGPGPRLCVLGDTHGHLQLGLALAALWQEERGSGFEAVLLCGDVGTFTDESQLDSATRGHARRNACELEFLRQWAADPQPDWIPRIFRPAAEGGWGIRGPVIMTHGNHEGFARLRSLHAGPAGGLDPEGLPAADRGGFIRYLPSGRRCRLANGLVVAAVGGIEAGQREASYDPGAFLEEDAVRALLEGDPPDVLITHQGPALTQGDKGASALDILLERRIPRLWFHGHSIGDPRIRDFGGGRRTTVVPLQDVAFPSRGDAAGDPGDQGVCVVDWADEPELIRGRPREWRTLRRARWIDRDDPARVRPGDFLGPSRR